MVELQHQVEQLQACHGQQQLQTGVLSSQRADATVQQVQHEAWAAQQVADALREKLARERSGAKLLKQRSLQAHRLLGDHIAALKEQLQAAIR